MKDAPEHSRALAAQQPAPTRALLVLALLTLTTACKQSLSDILLGPSRPAEETKPAPEPTPTPAPTPAAAPAETPPADPECQSSREGDVPCNTAPVARVGAHVYFIECDGAEVPGTEDATEVPLGCRIHLNATAKDSSGNPTRAKGSPQWSVNDPSLIQFLNRTSYTPSWQTRAPGTLQAAVAIDGVWSNTLSIRIY